jgi:hypothetical protein
VDDKVSLRIKGEFPASNAVIRILSVRSSGLVRLWWMRLAIRSGAIYRSSIKNGENIR